MPAKYKETEIGLIPEDWEIFILSDIINVNPKRTVKRGDKVKFVSMPNLKEFNKKIQNFEYKTYSGGSRFKNGDTIVARITPSLENGKTAYVDFLEDNEIAAGSTEFIVLSPKKELTTSQFTYYISISPIIRKKLIKSMTGTSGRQRVENDVFNHIYIQLPSINEQKRITNFLSAIDQKIELNHQMNQTLEALGQAIFRHWFIDFEFPDENGQPYKSGGGEMVDSELGKIPQGWEIEEIGKSIETTGGGTPSTKKEEYWKNGNIKWFVPRDITSNNQMFILESEKSINELGLNKSSAKLFPPYSLMMTSRATVGELSINTKEACTNQGFITCIPNEKLSTFYLYYWIKMNKEYIISLASGSTFKEINKSTFRSLKIIIPKSNIMKSFNFLLEPLFCQIQTLHLQNENLSQIRNSLLPKLMSGKIRVPLEDEK